MEISELQKDLAATFRWTARLNMHEGVANHFSACIPGTSDFYCNKAGIHFSRIKASDLILVTKDKPSSPPSVKTRATRSSSTRTPPTASHTRGKVSRK